MENIYRIFFEKRGYFDIQSEKEPNEPMIIALLEKIKDEEINWAETQAIGHLNLTENQKWE